MPSRKKEIISARHLFFYLLANYTYLENSAIAKKYNYDHATIYYAISNFENRMNQDKNLQKWFEKCVYCLK